MAGILTQEEQDVVSRIQRAKKECGPWHDKIVMRRKLYNFDHYDGDARTATSILPTRTL